jgi:hypothetical protein
VRARGGQHAVPGQTIVFPSGQTVAGPPPHGTVQLPPSQITLHDFALLQST